MKQLIFIRGGEAFDTHEDYLAYLHNRSYNPFDTHRSWRDWVGWALSDEFQIMEPTMPCKQNAQYEPWKIWFEKLFPYLNDEPLVVVGHSLGGLFLAKYLSENDMPKRISQLHLVAPIFDNMGLQGETVGDFTIDPAKFPRVEVQCDRICIYQSNDDIVCPPYHGKQYAAHMPTAKFMTFEHRGHFLQPAFPELLENITKMTV
jgi:predicted alpha/beta hydrolase family esterase